MEGRSLQNKKRPTNAYGRRQPDALAPRKNLLKVQTELKPRRCVKNALLSSRGAFPDKSGTDFSYLEPTLVQTAGKNRTASTAHYIRPQPPCQGLSFERRAIVLRAYTCHNKLDQP